MNFLNIVLETKTTKTFIADLKTLLSKDNKAKSLGQAFKKDSDKIVDLIDYVMNKYSKELDKLMKDNNVNYDEAIDLLAKAL